MYEARLAAIQAKVRAGDLRLGPYVQQRLRERSIRPDELEAALLDPHAEVVEDYPEDVRGHTCLVLGRSVGRPLHVVLTVPPRPLFVITAYDPRSQAYKWDGEFRRRLAP